MEKGIGKNEYTAQEKGEFRETGFWQIINYKCKEIYK